MYLQQHLGRQACNGVGHSDHGAPDHIRGRALNGSIDCGALGKSGPRPRGVDLGCMDLTTEQRLDISVLFGKGLGVIHIRPNSREAFKIAIDKALRLAARNAQVARQPKAGNSVNHAKIDRLGPASYVRRHLVERYVEHFGCCHRMDVQAIGKRLPECRNISDMRENTQLDLAVVQRDQRFALFGDKCFADAAAFFGSDGDILQVGVC